MREIKFRAMTLPSIKEIAPIMVYGTGIFKDPCNTWLYKHIDDSLCMHGNMENKIINPDTIGQYTGLADGTKWQDLTEKEREAWTLSGNMPSAWSGKEIYENDIVKVGDEYFVIKISFYGIILSHKIKGNSMPLYANPTIPKVWLVVGNIHENGDLLK